MRFGACSASTETAVSARRPVLLPEGTVTLTRIARFFPCGPERPRSVEDPLWKWVPPGIPQGRQPGLSGARDDTKRPPAVRSLGIDRGRASLTGLALLHARVLQFLQSRRPSAIECRRVHLSVEDDRVDDAVEAQAPGYQRGASCNFAFCRRLKSQISPARFAHRVIP